MSSDLIKATLEEQGLIVSEQEEQMLGELNTGKTFLPRIQLMQALSGPVNAEPPLAAKGDFVLTIRKGELINLGREFVCVPVTFRLKVTEFAADGTINSYFDINSPEFARVKDKSKEGFDSGCLAGPEFLLWLPDVKMFATYHLTSQTAQGMAKTLRGLAGEPVAMKSTQQENRKKQKYNVPSCMAFNGQVSAMPDAQVLGSEIKSFRNPESSVVEDAEDTTNGRAQ